jgi:hypothetical protein
MKFLPFSRRLYRPILAAGALLALLVLPGASAEKQPQTADEPALEAALKKARVNGKYEMLLRQIKVVKDRDRYSAFRDTGLQDRVEYAGHKDLAKGHWVYVAPYWYIWRDLAKAEKVKRPWGPEQATGPPDTDQAGDFPTAWASLTPDGQDEWLLLEYAEPIVPKEVVIHETFNPGAVYRVTAFKLNGDEVEIWKGADPTPADKESGVSVIPAKAKFKTNRVKVYIASKDVPGWNEIDAVGLRDAKGKTHWATAADASSTFARNGAERAIDGREQRIRKLEREVRELKEMVKELKELLKKEQ